MTILMPFAALIAQCSTCALAPFYIGATNGDHNRLQQLWVGEVESEEILCLA
jgi:hypothetical protein